MRPLLLLSTLCLCLCGCGIFPDESTADKSLDKARQLYQQSLDDVASSSLDTAKATQTSADALVLIVQKLDVVIENTSPRQRRAVGDSLGSVAQSTPPTEVEDASATTFPPASPPASAVPATTPPALSFSPTDLEPDVPSVVNVPPPTALSPPVTGDPNLARLADRLEEFLDRAEAPRSTSTGNSLTTPDGLNVGVKEYIADHATGRYVYEGDPSAHLASLGFLPQELECLTLAERGKLYDAWVSAHPPQAVAAPFVTATPAQCVNGQCFRRRR